MKPCEYEGCTQMGQGHHIVFRSKGGLNIEKNMIYLCARHHTGGKEAVHNNHAFDLKLKLELQDYFYSVFPDEEYPIEEIAERIGYNKQRLKKRMKAVPQRACRYQKEDIIRYLMGGKIYGITD